MGGGGGGADWAKGLTMPARTKSSHARLSHEAVLRPTRPLQSRDSHEAEFPLTNASQSRDSHEAEFSLTSASQSRDWHEAEFLVMSASQSRDLHDAELPLSKASLSLGSTRNFSRVFRSKTLPRRAAPDDSVASGSADSAQPPTATPMSPIKSH